MRKAEVLLVKFAFNCDASRLSRASPRLAGVLAAKYWTEGQGQRSPRATFLPAPHPPFKRHNHAAHTCKPFSSVPLRVVPRHCDPLITLILPTSPVPFSRPTNLSTSVRSRLRGSHFALAKFTSPESGSRVIYYANIKRDSDLRSRFGPLTLLIKEGGFHIGTRGHIIPARFSENRSDL